MDKKYRTEKEHFLLTLIMITGLLILLASLAGCASTSEAAEAARIENKKTLIEATVQPGKDTRCVSVMGFQMCYERERTVVE